MTTHTTPIDLRPYHGREFEGIINGEKCKGRISIDETGDVMLCQNVYDGADPSELGEFNKYGYKYTCIAQFKYQECWVTTHLTSITLLDEPNPINPEWDWKDGEIVMLNNREYKVCKIHDDIVVFIVDGRSTGSYTNQEAYIEGWRKLSSSPQRKRVEITEEMFDKTNLIGRKVEYNDEEYEVFGMIHSIGVRTLKLLMITNAVTISQCKLIEE